MEGVMKKLLLTIPEAEEWRKNFWYEYASETYEGQRLKLLMNLEGDYQVIHGCKILYDGIALGNAIRHFNLPGNPAIRGSDLDDLIEKAATKSRREI